VPHGFGRLVGVLPLCGGANNRVYRVDTELGPLLLKVYFQHPADPRNRLVSEFCFSHFAWSVGLRCLPKPIAADVKNHLGLYEFVSGRLLEAPQVTRKLILEALHFFCELNRSRNRPEAAQLPQASDAYFSFTGHLQCVENRLRRLSEIGDKSIIDQEASRFVRNALIPTWRRVSRSVCDMAAKLDISLEDELPEAQRCLSPSDFGFHNAIMSEDGSVRFIDFEYAGWDDPAKMVSDFFCQPKVPVSMENYDMFVRHTAQPFTDSETHQRRCLLMLPVYRVKWCCIMLNDFLAVDSQRRRFAHMHLDLEKRKEEQLQKAETALQGVSGVLSVEDGCWWTSGAFSKGS
jgi:hypothetical protein